MALVTPLGHGMGYVRRPDRPALPAFRPPADAGTPPATVDLRHLFLPAFDQGPYGTCTCNGAASQLEYELRRQRVGVPYHRSRSYPYYYSGVAEGDTGDTGRDPHDVFAAIHAHGDPPEKDWPYYPAVQMGQVPDLAAQRAAARRTFLAWYDVPRAVGDVRAALAQGYSVGMAFAVWSSFEAPATLSGGIVPIPRQGEDLLGYHYVVIGGYTDPALPPTPTLPAIPAQSFLVLNSWGALGLGGSGWFAFPYGFLTADGPDGAPLVQELIALELVTP